MLQGVAMGVELTIAKSVDHLALPLKTKRRSRKGIACYASFARGSGRGPLLYVLIGYDLLSLGQVAVTQGSSVTPLSYYLKAASLEDIATVCTVYKG
jgi:hypothetical protein